MNCHICGNVAKFSHSTGYAWHEVCPSCRADAALGRAVSKLGMGQSLSYCGTGLHGLPVWSVHTKDETHLGPTPEAALITAGLMKEEEK